MSLEYPNEWKFEGVGIEIPAGALQDVFDLVLRICGNDKSEIEYFKSSFGDHGSSSNMDWAIGDLRTAMEETSGNAAEFIDALWNGVVGAGKRGIKVPKAKVINSILTKHDVPLVIDPPKLVLLENRPVVSVGDVPVDEEGGTSDQQGLIQGEELGRGGYGVVYRAHRKTVAGEFHYALKLLDPSPFVSNKGKALSRFKREIVAVQKLQHRAIISYVEAGMTADGLHYLLMPLISGTDLRKATEGIELAPVLKYFIEIVNALDYAHNSGVVHRDLKPSNILVRESDDQPIILDFGSSYLIDMMDSETLTTQAVGTYGYIPTEVIADPTNRDPGQDLYACGVMLYECIARRRPDPADYAPLESIDSAYADLDPIIQRAIANRSKRVKSAAELANLLTRIISS